MELHSITRQRVTPRVRPDEVGILGQRSRLRRESVRAVVREGAVVEWNDYYAYGAVRDKWSLADGRWKYLGKELDNETATQHLDAREYDPFVGIFNKPDRFEFLYPSLSPYVYERNSPMRFHDATGDTAQEIVVTADRDPARQATVTTVALPTSSPPFRGMEPLASLFVLMWEIKQLLEGLNSLIGSRLSPPQLMPADATGVYKPFPGQLQQPTIMIVNPTKKVNELKLLHKKEVIEKNSDYEKIKRLSDEALIQSVVNPKNRDVIRVDQRTGIVMDGNTRIYELQRRGLNIDVPFEVYSNNNSKYFKDE